MLSLGGSATPQTRVRTLSRIQTRTHKPNISGARHMPESDKQEWPPQLDAVIAAAKNHRVLMEDDAVRVLEVTVDPGERENLHHHRWPSIMVVMIRPNYVNRDAEARPLATVQRRARWADSVRFDKGRRRLA